MISEVSWAVAFDKASGKTRPEQLSAELAKRGIVSPCAAFRDHAEEARRLRSHPWTNWSVELDSAASRAVMSPVFLALQRKSLGWIDLYDDWTLAPDIRWLMRGLAAIGYARTRHGSFSGAVVTTNSRFMADRLAPHPVSVVPNGASLAAAQLKQRGDSRRRLLVLGHFFPGRTDFGLLSRIAIRDEFDEVVVGGPGSSMQMKRVLAALSDQLGERLKVHDWIGPELLETYVGPRTVSLIPHLVRDYTISQDLMKIYDFLAMGVKVMCPRMLWPDHLSFDNALLLDYGVDLDGALRQWIDSQSPSLAWRASFYSSHSWAQRASAIETLLLNRNAPA